MALGTASAAAGGWAWAVTAFALIAPDLAFLAAIGAPGPHRHGVLPRQAVPYHNATHRFSTPLALLLLSWLTDWPVALDLLALGWLSHVLLDRAAGYGLRAPDGTRLPIGARPRSSRARAVPTGLGWADLRPVSAHPYRWSS